MSLFVVFEFKKPGHPPVSEVMAELAAAAHLQPRALMQHTYSVRNGRRVHILALSTPTALYTADDQVHIGPTDALLLNGYAIRPGADTPKPLRAGELARGFGVKDFDDLAGDFAVAHVSRSGKLTALSDLHRVQSVYYVDSPEVFAVSTRPSLLATLTGRGGFDPLAITANTAMGYGIGELTVFEGVRAVPQGRALRWNGRQLHFVERRAITAVERSRPWRCKPDLDERLDAAIQASGQLIDLASKGGPVRLGITGGKDSRLILALCLATGLRSRVELFTDGEPAHPDVQVGRTLAELVGVPHTVNKPHTPGGLLDADAFMERLAVAAFQTDGLVGAWDAFSGERTGTSITVNGLMGEVLKAFAKKDYRPTARPRPPRVVSLQSPFDPMRVLRPRARECLVNRLDAQFDAHLAAGRTYDDLPDLFYLQNRIPNWLGVSKQVETFTKTVISPLGAPQLTRLAFQVSAVDRKRELLHFLLLRRAAPELVDVPFALQAWDASLPVNPQPPVPMPVGTPQVKVHGTWQHSVNAVPEVRAALREVLQTSNSDVVWRVIDKEALLARLHGPPLAVKGLISLLGLVVMVLFVEGRAIPRKLETDGAVLASDYTSRLFPHRGVEEPGA